VGNYPLRISKLAGSQAWVSLDYFASAASHRLRRSADKEPLRGAEGLIWLTGRGQNSLMESLISRACCGAGAFKMGYSYPRFFPPK